MKKTSLLAIGALLLGFSTPSTFAENSVSNFENDNQPYFDRLNQVQRNGVKTKSDFIEEALGTKNDLAKLKAKIVAKNVKKKEKTIVKNPRPVGTKAKETAKSKADKLRKDGKLKPNEAISNSLTLRKNVVVSTDIALKLVKLGKVYRQQTGKNLVVTSVSRDAKTQARAIRGLIKQHGVRYVERLYKNKTAIKQIINAYQQHKNKNAGINAMTQVIESQISKGIFISNHLKNRSFDVSGKTNAKALAKAVKSVGGSFFFEGGNHYHIDLPNGKIKPTNLSNTVKSTNKIQDISNKKLTVAEVRNIFYPGKTVGQLTSSQRKELLRNYNLLLKRKATLAWLIALTKVEGSPSPYTIVGYLEKSGYKYTKTPDCQQRIAKLTLKSHPKEQGLPQQCFKKTEAGPSSASGYGQFVNKTWQRIKNRLKLKSFSRKSQAIGMLELGRETSRDGFTGIVVGDLKKSVKATKPWAGSDGSNLPGKKGDFVGTANREMKKLKDQKYYQKWLDEFMNDKDV